MNFEDIYIKEAENLRLLSKFDGIRNVGWRSPSNIALIKYWGKRDIQLPQNPSLSFALTKSVTETRIQYYYKPEKGISVDFIFDGDKNESFKARIIKYLDSILIYIPFLENLHFTINSKNSFPHSSGIASSASAMSALALCLVSIENDLFGLKRDEKSYFQKASFLARLGSGSAARSVFGGYTVWGQHEAIGDSHDEIAIPLGIDVDQKFRKLQDAILITSSKTKKVSSSEGHQLMNSHRYADARYNQARQNLNKLVNSLKSGNEKDFIEIVENEALSLHALMMSAQKGYTLLNENTWQIIDWIREYRKNTNTFLTFTLDAGPNVHMLYQEKDKVKITSAIESELIRYCEQGKWIDDQMGAGPEMLK